MDIQSKVQIEEMKAQIEQQRLALEQEKIRLEVIQAQMPQPSQREQVESGNDTPNVMRAKLLDLDELEAKQQQEAMEAQQREQMQAEQQAFEAQLEAEKEMMEQQRSEMLMSQLSSINESVSVLAAAVTAPKQVIRDPKTGLIQGVTTVN